MQSLWLQVSLLSIILNPSPSVPYSSLVGKKNLDEVLVSTRMPRRICYSKNVFVRSLWLNYHLNTQILGNKFDFKYEKQNAI